MNDADKALDFIRKNGWNKGTMKNWNGDGTISVCMAGAVRYGLYPVYPTLAGRREKFVALPDLPVIQEAAKVIEAEYPERITHSTSDEVGIIATFNDHHKTVFEDVERVYEKTSARLDEKI